MCLALSGRGRRALARRTGFCLFCLRRSCADVRAGFVGVLGKVVVEHVHQFVGLCGVGGFVLPALFGTEDVIRYAAAFGDDGEAEARVGFARRVGEFTAVDGVQYGARVFEFDAFAGAVGATCPAGVDEPDVDVVFFDFFGEQFGVFGGMPNHEGRAEAGGEGGGRFGDAHFRARDFGGVAGDEVEHGLFGGEFGDGRQYAEGVAGEEDDVGGLACGAGDARVADVFDGVGAPGVFGDAGVAVVNDAAVFVVDDVFEDGAEGERTEDVRLFFGGEVDGFGVAAAFDVEDAVVCPDVFVIADEFAFGVGGEGGFAGAGEAEEDGGFRPAWRCGGRAVHGEFAFERHEVVHDGEDAFFHFAGVFGAEDDHVAFFKGQGYGCAGVYAFYSGVRALLAGVVDDVVRFAEVVEFFGGGADEHVVHEEGVVGAGGDDAHFEAVFFIPAGVAVKDVNLFGTVEEGDGAFAVFAVRGGAEGDVDVAPPDVVFGVGVFDDTFVFGRASGFRAGGGYQCAGGGDGRAAVVGQCRFVERCRGKIAFANLLNTVLFQVNLMSFLMFHTVSPVLWIINFFYYI